MKVVLFCGGQGMRLREYSESVPKPMVPIGYRPVLWHVMKYYAHHGHKDFVLCLGHGADVVKNYFLHYDEALTNDFVMSQGGRNLSLLNSDIHDWTITFVDTGYSTNIGGRLRAVREHLEGEEMFLANYADCLTDAPLNDIIEELRATDDLGTFLCVPPKDSFHLVRVGEDGRVSGVQDVKQAGIWINGGYFVLRQEIFENLHQGDELVIEAFARLIEQNRLRGHRYRGFWAPMDTFKEKLMLDELHRTGQAPWELWRHKR
jgi:glucose-1-phosphate cytidylyltransferase